MCGVSKVPSVKHEPSEVTWETLRQEDPAYAKLAVHWRLEAERERYVYAIDGVAGGDRTLCTNAADVATTCAALLERMIYAKINGVLCRRSCHGRMFYDEFLGDFRLKVVKSVGRVCHPVEAQEFVESYTGRKRTMYESKLVEYLRDGVKTVHATLKAFMKVEKVPMDKSPRIIQPRDGVFNIGLGRYLKHMEKPIFRAIAKVFRQRYVVFKGLNADEMGGELRHLWGKFRRPVAVGIDASRFDASVDVGLLEWEHALYNMLFKDKELARLLRMQLVNRGVSYCHDGKIKYQTKGGRGSGDMNTSLGNSLIMCAIIYSWLARCGVKAKLVNNGDDCVVLMEEEELALFSDGFGDYARRLGFTMVVEAPVYEFEDIEFCQTHPVFVSGGWRMVRNLMSAREKDSLCLFPLTTKGALESWLYAVGECGMALTSGVPVFQEMYAAYMRSGKPSKMGEAVFMQSGSRMMARGMESKWVAVSPDSRVSFERAFGWTPDEQVSMEDYYRQLLITGEFRLVHDVGDVGQAPM